SAIRRRFDLVGLLLGSSGLAIGILGVSQGSQWGWRSPTTLGCLAAGVLLLAAFVTHSRRRTDPLIDLQMFSVSAFRTSIGVVMLVAFAQYSRLVFIPLQLQELRDYSALHVGVLF